MWKAYLAAYPQSGNEFWELTPRIYWLKMQAFSERYIDDHNLRMSIAYHTAAFSKADKLPDLKKFLISKSKQTKMSDEDQQILLDQKLKLLASSVKPISREELDAMFAKPAN